MIAMPNAIQPASDPMGSRSVDGSGQNSLPMTSGQASDGPEEKSYVLTFLAPAVRCNQRCPKCFISQVRQERATSFDLTPQDYVKFVDDFLASGNDVISLAFQGYEVTLPQSWPYLEAVFDLGKSRNIRRSFITNGMLLHKYAGRIIDLDPARISISLDGADAAGNDRHRGVNGAFDTTLSSIRKFLQDAPGFDERLAIVSVLYGRDNFDSLLQMPKLVRDLGLRKWGVAVEVESDADGGLRYAAAAFEDLVDLVCRLKQEAADVGIKFFVTDELQRFDAEHAWKLGIARLPRSMELVRLLPSGHVYTGLSALAERADPNDAAWRPSTSAIDFIFDRLPI